MTRLTMMGLPFQAFSIELLEWGCACPKMTKMGSMIGHKIDLKLTITG